MGVVRPRADISAHRHPPLHPLLATVVDRHWCSRWDRHGQAPWTTEVLSDPLLTISFLDVVGVDGQRVRESWFTGVSKGRFHLSLEGRGLARGVSLRPGGHLALVSTSAEAFLSTRRPLATILPGIDASLTDVWRALGDDDRAGIIDGIDGIDVAATAAIEDALLAIVGPRLEDRAVLARITDVVERTERALRVVKADPAIVTVEDLAATVGEDTRTLQRLFQRCVGLGPKWVIHRFRLQEAVYALQQDPDRSVVDLAQSLGYFDQPHFARIFKAVVGVAPRTYAKAERVRRQQEREQAVLPR